MLIVGDIHAGNKRPFSTITSTGINSRLADTLTILRDISAYSSKIHNKNIIFLGDIFDCPGETIPKDVLIWVHNAFRRLSDSCNNIVIISGNHDCFRGRSVLGIFDDIKNVTIILEPTTIKIEERLCYFIPYTRDAEQLLDWLKEAQDVGVENAVLFGHFSVKGSWAGKQFYHLNDGIPIGDIPTSFEYVLLGHVHSAQQLGHVVYVGSIMQINASEEEEEKHMIELTDKLRVIPLGGPRFHTVEIHNGDFSYLKTMRTEHPDDYYTVVLKDQISEEELPKSDHRIRVIRDYDGMREERLEIKKTESLEDLLKKYMEEYETTLNKEKLIEVIDGIFRHSDSV